MICSQLEKGFDIDFEEVDASIRMNSVDNNFLKKGDNVKISISKLGFIKLIRKMNILMH